MANTNIAETVHTATYDLVLFTKENGEEETVAEVMQRLLVGIDCTYVVAQEVGPGGGWPVVEVTGRLDQLDRFHAKYNEDGWPTDPPTPPSQQADELAVHLPGGVDPRG
jgi:hypothetical protein